jgi:AcrR family transcriptional regulator
MQRTKQDVVSEFRHSEILDAARKLFARRGFEGATMEEIAEAAGVAKGTLYLYFQSKNEIHREALKQGLVRLIEETRRNVDAAPTSADKIRAFIATRIRLTDNDRDLIRIHHSQSGSSHPAYLNKECRNLYLEQARMLEAVLREAAAQGQIRSDRMDVTAVVVYEMIRGLIMQRLLGWSRASVEEDTDLLFDLIWRGLAR